LLVAWAAVAGTALLAADSNATSLPPATTAVYKCAGSAGAVIYQESPCPEGRQLRDFAAEPASVSVIPFASGSAAPPAMPRSGAGSSSPRNTRTLRVESGSARTSSGEKKPSRAAKSNAGDAMGAKGSGDPAERRHLRYGMSEGEVLAKVGAPDATSSKGNRSARWIYLPAARDPQTVTSLRFEDGKVVGVDRKVVR
jgi:hypothetical protein